MKKKNATHFTYWLSVIVIGLTLGLFVQFVQAWTEPSAPPPGGNLGAPLNTGALTQVKAGTLGVNSNGNPVGLVVNGNVGIGTPTPDATLAINGPDPTKLLDLYSGGSTRWYTGVKDASGSALQFVSGGKPIMTLNKSDMGSCYGCVGIGTDNPDAKLHISGGIAITHPSIPYDTRGNAGARAGIIFGANHPTNNAMFWISPDATSGNRLNIGAGYDYSDANSMLTIDVFGNVGIGTAGPGAKLEVVGGPTKTTGGLIIETRTSDPPSPETGRMWLRTDL